MKTTVYFGTRRLDFTGRIRTEMALAYTGPNDKLLIGNAQTRERTTGNIRTPFDVVTGNATVMFGWLTE